MLATEETDSAVEGDIVEIEIVVLFMVDGVVVEVAEADGTAEWWVSRRQKFLNSKQSFLRSNSKRLNKKL